MNVDSDFLEIKKIAENKIGIELSNSKNEIIMHKVFRRMSGLHLHSMTEYIRLLNTHYEELQYFINIVTNISTHFFREKAQFEYLRDIIIPKLLHQSQSIKIWSAGCSTGEEPYSIALTIANKMPAFEEYDIKILATDINTEALSQAIMGAYSSKQIESIESYSLWFNKIEGKDNREYQINDRIKSLIRFRKLNLLDHWPLKNPFNIIFFRNVSIYMTEAVVKVLFKRFDQYLKVGGYLFIGSSESLPDNDLQYNSLGNSIYQKI